MAKVAIRPFRPVYPSPAALISSIAADGKPNLITLGEVFNLSIASPVIVGIAIAPARYSNELIRASREFVVNFPTRAILEKVDRCGSVSGRTVDKFRAFGLTPLPATRVRPPLVAECPINLECQVREIMTVGDHDLFIGEVVAEHVDADKLLPDGQIDVDRLDAIAYMFGQYRAIGGKLGTHGFTRGRA